MIIDGEAFGPTDDVSHKFTDDERPWLYTGNLSGSEAVFHAEYNAMRPFELSEDAQKFIDSVY